MELPSVAEGGPTLWDALSPLSTIFRTGLAGEVNGQPSAGSVAAPALLQGGRCRDDLRPVIFEKGTLGAVSVLIPPHSHGSSTHVTQRGALPPPNHGNQWPETRTFATDRKSMILSARRFRFDMTGNRSKLTGAQTVRPGPPPLSRSTGDDDSDTSLHDERNNLR